MIFRRHISKANAAAHVHAPEILSEVTRAMDANSADARIEHLREARNSASEILDDIDAAIAIEEAEKAGRMVPA